MVSGRSKVSGNVLRDLNDSGKCGRWTRDNWVVDIRRLIEVVEELVLKGKGSGPTPSDVVKNGLLGFSCTQSTDPVPGLGTPPSRSLVLDRDFSPSPFFLWVSRVSRVLGRVHPVRRLRSGFRLNPEGVSVPYSSDSHVLSHSCVSRPCRKRGLSVRWVPGL